MCRLVTTFSMHRDLSYPPLDSFLKKYQVCDYNDDDCALMMMMMNDRW